MTGEKIAVAEKTRVSVKRVLADLKGGMSDKDLKAKYELSSRGLRSLFRKLDAAGLLDDTVTQKRPDSERPSPKGGYPLKSFVDDIEAGLPNDQLIQKYQLSHWRLRRILMRLISVGLVDQTEIETRLQRLEEADDETCSQDLKHIIDDTTDRVLSREEMETADD